MIEASDDTPDHLAGDTLFMWVSHEKVTFYEELGWHVCLPVEGRTAVHHDHYSVAMWKPVLDEGK